MLHVCYKEDEVQPARYNRHLFASILILTHAYALVHSLNHYPKKPKDWSQFLALKVLYVTNI